MKNSEYNSDRYFRMWIYIVSHSSLLIRSEKQYEDVSYEDNYKPNNTIDIEFSGIEYISIPTDFKGISIKKVDDKYIFNNDKNLYIIASSCIIGISDFDHTKDRFNDLSLKYDEIVMTL